jgi:hypothetical protein
VEGTHPVILGNLLIQQERYPLIFPNRSENGLPCFTLEQ